MTTLATGISSGDTIIVVTPDEGVLDNGFRFRVDDEILEYLGPDRSSTLRILEVRDGDTDRWHVARGRDGTAAASHLSGATLYAVGAAFATSGDLTPPSPFAAGAEPSAAAPFPLALRTLTADVTIPAGMGAITVGPLDLDGHSITFEEGSALAILEAS